MMAQFPSRKIAELSYEYRTLGLGYANIGGLLMSSGIPYDFAGGPRHLRARITALMTGISYATSAEMAGELGAFPGYAKNRERDAARHAQPPPRRPWPRPPATRRCTSTRCRSTAHSCPDQRLVEHARDAWDRAVDARRDCTATATPRRRVIAPTGTIGLSWIATPPASSRTSRWSSSRSSPAAATSRSSTAPCPRRSASLGYRRAQIADDRRLRRRPRHAEGRAGDQPRHAEGQGLHRATRSPSSKPACASAFDIKFVFNKWTLGEDFCSDVLEASPTPARRPGLRHAGRARLLQEGHRGRQHLLSAAR